MKINVDKVLINIIDDKPFFEMKDGQKKPVELTFKDVSMRALLSTTKPLNHKDSFERYTLAKKIKKGGEVNITSEDMTKIKEVLADTYSPGVIGACVELLGE